MPLTAETVAEELCSSSRKVPFSYWPTIRSGGRFKIQSRVFASVPLNVIENYIHSSEMPTPRRKEALAYFSQARDFFVASKASDVRSSKSLLVYYCFMNLLKAYLLTKGPYSTLGDTHHGLTLDFATVRSKPTTARMTGINTHTSGGGVLKINLFDELVKIFNPAGLPQRRVEIKMSSIFPQILLGHRLWCQASSRKERFINIEHVAMKHDLENHEIWANIELSRPDYRRLGYKQNDLLDRTGLREGFFLVEPVSDRDAKIVLEMDDTITCPRPADRVLELAQTVRPFLWASVTTIKPFRKYYLYLSDGDDVYPQICSIYAMFFFLGSLARYRPHKLQHFVDGDYGAFISEFVNNQIDQYLYLFASIFVEQEVSKAAVV